MVTDLDRNTLSPCLDQQDESNRNPAVVYRVAEFLATRALGSKLNGRRDEEKD